MVVGSVVEASAPEALQTPQIAQLLVSKDAVMMTVTMAPAPAPVATMVVAEAPTQRLVNLSAKWAKALIELVQVSDDMSLREIKEILSNETSVPCERMKLCGLKRLDGGKLTDETRLRQVALKLPTTKFILMGTPEASLLRAPSVTTEIFDDLGDSTGRYSEWEWRMLNKGELSSKEGSTSPWVMVWSDTFNYEGKPRSGKWEWQTDCNDWIHGANFEEEQQTYTTMAEGNAVVKDGTLRISAIKDPRCQYTSARLTTRKSARWRYGRIEVCARLTPGMRGLWPAIWLMPTHSKFGDWPKSGEVDIMENVGFEPNVVRASVHTSSNHRRRGNHSRRVCSVKDAHDAFHVYALEWTESELCFFVDGKRYFRYCKKLPFDSQQWPFDEEFHLILNVAVGGSWAGHHGIDPAAFPATMEVAFVKVFQRRAKPPAGSEEPTPP